MRSFKIGRKKTIQSVLFLIAGILLFWYVYKDVKIAEIKKHISELTFGWIYLSLGLNLISLFLRSLRWNMLITPLGYNPSRKNLFLAMLVLSFTNLVIPRGGELARGAVITKYEKIPFVKLFGTVVIERIIDLLVLILLFATVLIWQYPYFQELLQSPAIEFKFPNLQSKIITIIIAVVVLAIIFFVLQRTGVIRRFRDRIRKIKVDLLEGLRVFSKVHRKGWYIILSVIVYWVWLFMLYVIFFAFEPTSQLPVGAAIFTFAASTFAFVLPVQAGMGAWHFMVVQCLLLFGIDKDTGLVFALIAHTFTNLIYLVFGGIGFVLLPVLNKTEK
ncbi:MAG: flippase-like domain-containing protein [Bacteroidetes bacterium]|jgi:uncharacterized protein (TIRG00374 family)|nr:flippase-like domain-containing protein [Bacteroidota bacterium]